MEKIKTELYELLGKDFRTNSHGELVISITSSIHIFSNEDAENLINELRQIIIRSKMGIEPNILEKMMYHLLHDNSY